MDKIFAVQNCGTSGTLFLQSLFDNHPKVLSLPALHGQTLLLFWQMHSGLPKAELLNQFLNDYPYFFSPTAFSAIFGLNDMGTNRNEAACVDKEQFITYLKHYWNEVESLTRKLFVVSIYKAYNRALGKQIDESGYLLYPIHCLPLQYAEQLVEDFREVKFLHMMRESVQNIGSLANHISKNSDWGHCYLLSCCIAQIFNDHSVHVGSIDAHGLTPYVKDCEGVTTRALKLESVHQDAQNSLLKVCRWLGIEWNECLLQSTFDGKLWHNRAESIRQTGIGTETISQKHQHLINRFDRYRLDYLSIPYKNYYGYFSNRVSPSKLILILMPILLLLPFKMELIRKRNHNYFMEYLKCRFKWLYPAWRSLFRKKEYIQLL